MGVHPFPAIDPATNYLTMTGGAGAGPMHAYSAAMSTLGTSGQETVVSSALNTASTAAVWSGAGQVRAAASVSELNTTVTDASAKALLKAELAQAAGELHTMTVARMVTHVQANANRAESAADNAINPLVWGALSPRIAELELEYYAMWANNAQAGVGYGAGLDGIGGALAALSALPSLAGGSVAAPAMAAADVAANAGITMASAAMSTAEQGATALITPATAATTSSATNNLLGNTPLAAPGTASSSIQPMAAVQTYAPTTPSAPTLTPAQAPVMGMFAPPPSAAVTPPAPSPALPATPPPVSASPPMPTPAPRVTSFVPPAEPFAPPPPTAGRAGGLGPGMLNAAALRGPVSTMPLTTTTTSTLATATQPLGYVPPAPPPPEPAPPSQALFQTGTIDTLQTPPTPPPSAQLLTPPAPPHPTSPPVPQSGPPAPSTDAGGTGVQMLGTGPGGAPQAPPAPMPLDPEPTPPPPPPVRGRAPEGIHPPVEGPLTPGPPSRARERRKGGEHLWDDQGGEWRYHGEDSDHNPHWDYKPPGKNTEWEQIPIGDVPPMKGGVDPSLIAKLPPWMQNLLAPGVPGGPQNPLLAPYPGATMPAPPPAYVPPPDPGLLPPIDMPNLDPGSAMPIAGSEVVVIDGILVLLIAGLVICLG